MAAVEDLLKDPYFADVDIDLSQFSEEEKTVIAGVMQKAKVGYFLSNFSRTPGWTLNCEENPQKMLTNQDMTPLNANDRVKKILSVRQLVRPSGLFCSSFYSVNLSA